MWLRARSISRRDIRWARLLIFHPAGNAPRASDISWRRGIGGSTLHLVEFCLLAQERIEQAQEDWKTGQFAPVPGETVFL